MLLYYFTTAKHGLATIRDRKLKISEIEKVNDPFEFMALNLKGKDIRKSLKNWRKMQAKAWGFICMSNERSLSNSLMWAHYADRHKGMCLGFKVNDSDFIEINYERNKISANLVNIYSASDLKNLKIENLTDIQRKYLLLTKSCEWCYEKEFRKICRLSYKDPVTNLYFESFSNNENIRLSEVIIGSECSPEVTRQRVNLALNGIQLDKEPYKVRPAFQDYRIVMNKNDTLWK